MSTKEHFRSAAAGIVAAVTPAALIATAGTVCLAAGGGSTATLVVLAAAAAGGLSFTQDIARSVWNSKKLTFALAAFGTMAGILYGAYEAKDAYTERFIKSDDIERVEKGARTAPTTTPGLSV